MSTHRHDIKTQARGSVEFDNVINIGDLRIAPSLPVILDLAMRTFIEETLSDGSLLITLNVDTK